MKIVKVPASAAGGVVVQELSGPKTRDIALDEFLREWVVAASAQLVEKHPSWPASRTSTSETFKVLAAKGAIFVGLGSVSQQLEKFFDPSAKLQIMWKPARKVVASATIPAGGLVLSPDTLNVKALPEGQAPDGSSVQVEVQPAVPKFTFWLSATASADNVCAYWVVGTTAGESKANMASAKYAVQALVGMDYFGETPLVPKTAGRVGKKSAAKRPDDDATSCTIHVPVLVNTVALAPGTELLFYKAPAVKRERTPEPITVSKLAERSAAGQ